MQLEAKKLLEDIRQACERILRFTEGKELSDYTSDLPALYEQVLNLLNAEAS